MLPVAKNYPGHSNLWDEGNLVTCLKNVMARIL